MTKIIMCRSEDECKKYMYPFAYSPDKTNVFALGPIRVVCNHCHVYFEVSRLDAETRDTIDCPYCGHSHKKIVVVPDGCLTVFITPFTRAEFHFN